MHVLLTGGTGYIGSHIAVALVDAGHAVTLLDNFANSKPAVLDRLRAITGTELDFVEADVTDRGALDATFTGRGIEAVIHLAGPKSVAESVARPLHYYRVNVGGTATLCEAMSDHGVRNLVFSSSATVYGIPVELPLTEASPLDAINPYGRSKLIVDAQLLPDIHAADPAWNILVLRYFNPVGAHSSGQIGEDPSGPPANLVPFITQVAVGRRLELAVFGTDYDTRDGTAIRDYIHVVDLAEGHVAAVEHLATGPGLAVYNLGTGTGSTVLEVIAAFEAATGRTIPRRYAERRPGDAPAAWCDPAKAAADLGWRATRSLEEMCRDAWRWQSQNPDGYP